MVKYGQTWSNMPNMQKDSSIEKRFFNQLRPVTVNTTVSTNSGLRFRLVFKKSLLLSKFKSLQRQIIYFSHFYLF